jgi:DNA-binding transcriptional MerR regulator
MKISNALQLFEPAPNTAYTIGSAARLAHMPRRRIVIYCKRGLVSAMVDPARNGYYFDKEAILTLQRIENLRTVCGNDLSGIKIILDLMNEVDRLRCEAQSTRESSAAEVHA